MAIVGRTGTVVENASTQSITGTRPADRQAGDLVIAVFVMACTTAQFTGPGGSWVQLFAPFLVPNGNTLAAYYQVNPAADPTATSSGVADRASVICQAYGGVNPAAPIDVAAVTAVTNMYGTSLAVGGVTTATNGARLVSGCAVDSSTRVLVVPSGMTLVADASGGGVGRGLTVADEVRATAGGTGTRTWSQVGTDLGMGAFLVALRQAGALTGSLADTVPLSDTLATASRSYGAYDYRFATGVYALDDLEAEVGPRKFDWWSGFISFDSSAAAHSQIETAAQDHGILLAWQPSKTVGLTFADILSGTYDAHINDWITKLAALKKADGVTPQQAVIRFGHEMNGNWQPWWPGYSGGSASSNCTSAAQFVQVWQYMVGKAVAAGATNIKWFWCPNVVDVGGIAMEDFYPGSGYVDFVGYDSYNSLDGAWKSAAETLKGKTPSQGYAYDRVVALHATANVWVGETGCVDADDPLDVSPTIYPGHSKADWWTEVFTIGPATLPRLKVINFFSKLGTRNWRIDTSTQSSTAFSLGFNTLAASGHPRSVADTATPGDSPTHTGALLRSAADSVPVSDLLGRIFPRTAADTATPTDGAVGQLLRGRAAADTVPVADVGTRSGARPRAVADTVLVDDVVFAGRRGNRRVVSYYGPVTIGRLVLTESPDVTEKSDTARSLSLTGQEASPPLATQAEAWDRAGELLAYRGATVPVLWRDKPHLDGWYTIQSLTAAETTWGTITTVRWQCELTRVGTNADVEVESRLVGGNRTHASAAVAELWHAVPPWSDSYLVGASTPGAVIRMGEDGPVTVYRAIPAATNPRWGVTAADYLLAAAEVTVDEAVRTGLTCPDTPGNWALSNGLLRVEPRTTAGTLLVTSHLFSEWGTAKVFDLKRGTTSLGAAQHITILRNDPCECVLRLTWDQAPGRTTCDLSLKRGARHVAAFVQQYAAPTPLRVDDAGAAATVTDQLTAAGYIASTSDDQDGNRWVLGSTLACTAAGTFGLAADVAAQGLPAYIGCVYRGASAASGDTAAHINAQYLGAPTETERVIAR